MFGCVSRVHVRVTFRKENQDVSFPKHTYRLRDCTAKRVDLNLRISNRCPSRKPLAAHNSRPSNRCKAEFGCSSSNGLVHPMNRRNEVKRPRHGRDQNTSIKKMVIMPGGDDNGTGGR